jgi:exonuclease III
LGRLNIFEDLDGETLANDLNEIDPDLRFFNAHASSLQSKYYTDDSLRHLVNAAPDLSHSFSILHSNIRSFFANRGELDTLLMSSPIPYSVICLSETWLNSSNSDYAHIETYTSCHKTRSKKKGGGVSIFVRYDLPFLPRDDLSALNDVMESVFIEIDRKALGADRNAIIGCFYRPPNAPITEFNTAMKQTLDIISNERKHIFICGDFNIDLLNTDHHLPAAEFLETMFSSSLFPAISRPTRVSKTSATLIDNIFVNPLFASGFVSGVLVSSISDHLPVFCCTPLLTPAHTSIASLHKRNFCTANKEKFSQSLQSADWSQCLSIDACQSAFSEFYQKFTAIFNDCFPLIESKSRYKSRKPWLTDGLKKSIKVKNKLYAKFVKSKSNADLVAYRDYKKALRSILRRAERQHYDNLFLRHRNNMRKSWDVIKEVMNIQRTSNPKISLMINNKETSDPLEVANAFNSFFFESWPKPRFQNPSQ